MAVKAQTDAMMEAYDVIADSLIDNDMFFFRDRIENAYSKNFSNQIFGLRILRGKNDTIYERLPDEFCLDDAYKLSTSIKGSNCTRNSVQQMLKNWRKQGLIVLLEGQRYRKVS